jgi:hypothetical protein
MLGSNVYIKAPEPSKTKLLLDEQTAKNVSASKIAEMTEFEVFQAPEGSAVKSGDYVTIDTKGRQPSLHMLKDSKGDAVGVFVLGIHEIVSVVTHDAVVKPVIEYQA